MVTGHHHGNRAAPWRLLADCKAIKSWTVGRSENGATYKPSVCLYSLSICVYPLAGDDLEAVFLEILGAVLFRGLVEFDTVVHRHT